MFGWAFAGRLSPKRTVKKAGKKKQTARGTGCVKGKEFEIWQRKGQKKTGQICDEKIFISEGKTNKG